MDAQKTGDSSPSPIHAAAMLSEALAKNPDATVFEVNYQSGYPSGNVYSMCITYDRAAHTVYENEVGAQNGGVKFSGVTDEMIKSVASKHQEVLEVGSMGATQVQQ